MAEPGDARPTEGIPSGETLPAHSICEKINELVEDFQNGHISEARLAEMLEELHVKDEEHFLDKVDEYNKELRKRLEKIEIAKRALEASNVMVEAVKDLDKHPEVDKEHAKKFNKKINEKLLTVKDLGNAKEVTDALDTVVKDMENEVTHLKDSTSDQSAANELQKHVDDLKEITMGTKADYLGTTRLSLGTGHVLQGPLGEILNLGFDKLQVDGDNDTAKYISGYIVNARQNLAGSLKNTANQAYNAVPGQRPA